MARKEAVQLNVAIGIRAARRWMEALLGLFYPNICQICREERADARQGYVCRSCRERPGAIQLIKPPFCGKCGLPFSGEITTEFECSNCRGLELHFITARAAVAAKGLVLDVIHRYKYDGGLWFEPFLAQLLIQQAAPHLRPADWDLIVPVPLHPIKEREREFNQALRIARRLSKAVGIPVGHGLVKRVVATRTQTKLTREQRAENVAGAFAMRGKQRLEGQRVVLVDDVLTTGATASACAKVLRRNGSSDVCVWTIARGL